MASVAKSIVTAKQIMWGRYCFEMALKFEARSITFNL